MLHTVHSEPTGDIAVASTFWHLQISSQPAHMDCLNIKNQTAELKLVAAPAYLLHYIASLFHRRVMMCNKILLDE